MIHPSDWQCLRLGGWKNWTLIIGDHRWFHRWFTGDLPWKNPCRLAFRRDHSCSPPESANKESNLLESQIAPALWAFSLEVLFQDLWPRGLNPLSAFFSLSFSSLLGYEPPYSCCVCCPNRFCTFRGFPSHAAPPVIVKNLDSPCNKPSSYIRVPHDIPWLWNPPLLVQPWTSDPRLSPRSSMERWAETPARPRRMDMIHMVGC